VVERGAERFRAAAIAHIHAHHIHAGRERLGGGAQHVRRFAGAFQAMHDQNSERLPARLLPMTAAQNLDFRLHLKQALLRGRQMNAA
jgi:hypothetical protein